MVWQIREVDFPPEILRVAEHFASCGGEWALIDIAAREIAVGGPTHSLLCVSPIAVLEQAWLGPARLVVGGQVVRETRSGWELFHEMHAATTRMPSVALPLVPGWVGFIGYEMNGLLERLPAPRARAIPMPAARMAFFDRGIVIDHLQHRAYALSAAGIAERIGAGPSSSTANEIAERWNDAVKTAEKPHFPAPCANSGQVRVQHYVSRREYETCVERAKHYIAAGDIYQANLSHPIELQGLPSVFATAARVRSSNPSCFSAVLQWGRSAVISASPELFLHCRAGRVTTRPIKGTARRSGDAIVDRAARAALLASEKDRAELAMIVDLHRNDLGRVCIPGTIQVERARYLEEHPSVFHTVATITGRMCSEKTPIDLLMASFPPGSITGVPKIRAMEVIHELESVARGVYCGTIFGLGLDETLWANVAIRTIQLFENKGVMHVGGGVVADSDPAAEYDETWAKAQGVLRAFQPESLLAKASSGPLHYGYQDLSERPLA